MDRGAWQATVHEDAESDSTEGLCTYVLANRGQPWSTKRLGAPCKQAGLTFLKEL